MLVIMSFGCLFAAVDLGGDCNGIGLGLGLGLGLVTSLGEIGHH